MFVNGPPKYSYARSSEIQCTTTPGWPVFDTVLAGLELVRTGIAISAKDSDYQGAQLSRPADIGFGLAFMTLFAISAGVGYSRVSDCNDALGQGNMPRPRPRRVAPPPDYYQQRPPAPLPYGGPPPNQTVPPGGVPLAPPPPPSTGPTGGAAPPPAAPPPPPSSPPTAPVRQQIDNE
jgi:hypothetical protein